MGGTEIKTLGVQNESDHNREPLVRRNYTEQDIPEVRWTAPSFLDLPAGQYAAPTYSGVM